MAKQSYLPHRNILDSFLYSDLKILMLQYILGDCLKEKIKFCFMFRN